MMKLATWNVNSIKVRLDQVLDWLERHQPDVLCLQELKCQTEHFPYERFLALGYHAVVAGQKAYNGVALLGRTRGFEPECGFADFPDPQQRLIAGTFGSVRVISVYCPNGEAVGSAKYEYKLNWFAALQRELNRVLQLWPELVVAGDFNVAPTDLDVYDPKAWQGQILCSEPERQAFQGILNTGFHDAYREFSHGGDGFTWWNYRANGFVRNQGLRIDHLLVSSALRSRIRECEVDSTVRGLERPSDHAPLWLNLAPVS